MTSIEQGHSRKEILENKVFKAISDLKTQSNLYGILDLPYHRNIGDSAIFLGEVALLKKLYGRLPEYVSTTQSNLDEPGHFLPEGTIFLHGGGNFGDLWPRHQLYREEIIRRYPDRRVVQLPQSIHYNNPANVERVQRVIDSHNDFHLMVRDNESFNFAKKNFNCNVMLVPDCAFGIDMNSRARAVSGAGTLCLFRGDKERRVDAQTASNYFAEAKIEDWIRPRRIFWKSIKFNMGIANQGLRWAPQTFWIQKRWNAMIKLCEHLVHIGFNQLDGSEVVITDRLHGHIMSSLLGKPHVVVDNFYGKIHNFIRAWPVDSSVGLAKDYAHAKELAEDLRSRFFS